MVPRKLHTPKHLDPKNDTLKINTTFSNIIEDQIPAEIIHGKNILIRFICSFREESQRKFKAI